MAITEGIDLPAEQLRLVTELIEEFLPDVEVWAYGSRVHGNPRRYSDLDLVAFTSKQHLSEVRRLREAFEDSDLPIRVDLFPWEEIPESFRLQIEQNYAVLQSANPSATAIAE